MFKLFGFKIGKDEPEQSQPQSFVPKAEDDGAVAISAGGVYGLLS